MIYWLRKYFTDPTAHRDALYEVLTTAVFSLAPFFVPYFVKSAELTNGSIPMQLFFGRGQLYLFAYAVFGTIFWLAFVKGEKPRHGARALLGLLATFTILPVVGFLGVDPTFSTVSNPLIIKLGYWFYGALLFIHYLLLFFMNISPPEPAEVFNRETEDMLDRYKEMQSHG